MLFFAAAVSRLGTSISYVAMPLVAVTGLDASPGEVGLLAMLGTVAFLVIGLPSRDAVVLGSVPVAWWLGLLHIGQLYVVVLLLGVGSVFFDVASQSYVPRVVGRSALLAANTRLVSMDAVNDIAGRGIAGYLVAALTAPVALVIDAASYLVSAWCVTRVRHREERPVPAAGRLWTDIGEGVRFVARHPVLRAILVSGALVNLGIVLVLTMVPVVLVDELGLGAGVLGLLLASGGVGTLAGSLVARRLAARVGAGRLALSGSLLMVPCGFGMPLMDHGAVLWLAGRLGGGDRAGGRLQRDPRELPAAGDTGPAARPHDRHVPLPADGHALGQYVSPRAALFAGATAIALVWLPILFSPLRRLRELTG